jgi:hypothetical protein
VGRQYNFWLLFFHKKRKNQFIPLPWKIGEFMFRNINKIDEFANHFNNVNLKYAEKIKGFNPKKYLWDICFQWVLVTLSFKLS